MSRRIVALVMLFVASSLAMAHEFWMEPARFKLSVGETFEFSFKAGENFAGEPAKITLEKIAKLEHHTGSLVRDITGYFNVAESTVKMQVNAEGTHLFSLRGNNSFIEMDAEEFNEYLKAEGLDDILQSRESSNSLDRPAKEYYARCAKLLVKVGDRVDDTFKKVVGLPLEIVPLTDPYHLELTDEVKFQVYFQGKPLAFSLIKVWNRGKGRTFIQNIYTEKDGTFTTRLSNTGVWMVSTVKMTKARQPGADYQSFWSSLVFGFDE